MFKKYQHIERFGNDEVDGIEIGECFIFPKIDGTNSSLWSENNRLCAGSRNRQLTLDNDNAGFFNAMVKEDDIKRLLEDYPNLKLFGEWLVKHSLRTYRDDAWRIFYVFDVIEIVGEDSRYLPYEEYKPLLEKYNINYIPCQAIIKNPTYDNLLKECENNTFLIKDGEGVGEGCFTSDARVLMLDESQKSISKIKVGDIVKSYNTSTREIENKKVLNVFYNGKKPIEDWYNYCLFPKGVSSRGFDNKSFRATKTHKVYTGNNSYEGIEQVDGLYHYEPLIDNYRYQAILGLVMSDGCIDRRSIISLCQKKGGGSQDFCDVFSFFLNKPTFFISGKSSKMWASTFNKKYTLGIVNKFYKNGKQDYISISDELNLVGWSYFFMGDGSTQSNGIVELCIASFSEEQSQYTLQKFNSFFGVNAKLKKDKRVTNGSGYTIRTRVEDGKKVLKSISKYILPSFRYKLRGFDFINELESIPTIEKGLIFREFYVKKPISEYKTYKKYKFFDAYDIEVEDNNNYFIEKCLVHNCVIKNYDYENRFGRKIWAKIVTNEFKEKHTKEMGSKEIQGSKMIEEEIVEKFLTNEMIEKTYSKILLDNDNRWNSKMIPQLLNTIYHDFIVEEMWGIVKKHKNPKINFKTLISFINYKIKKCKKELF